MSLERDQSTLMINLGCNEHDGDLLTIAGDLAQQLNAAVMGVAAYELATDIAITVTGFGGVTSPQELLDDETQRAEARISAAKSGFYDALKGKADPLLWRATITPSSATEWLARNARSADLVITHPFADGSYTSVFRRVNPGDLIMSLGRPELLLPRGLTKLDLNTALIAWRNTSECRHAIAGALPLLKLAKKVIVAEIALPADRTSAQDDVNDVCEWLQRHAIAAEGTIKTSTGSDAQGVLALAASVSCDLLVAGAYGHSRMREWTLGGVTRDLLLRPRCATLIAH